MLFAPTRKEENVSVCLFSRPRCLVVTVIRVVLSLWRWRLQLQRRTKRARGRVQKMIDCGLVSIKILCIAN